MKKSKETAMQTLVFITDFFIIFGTGQVTIGTVFDDSMLFGLQIRGPVKR